MGTSGGGHGPGSARGSQGSRGSHGSRTERRGSTSSSGSDAAAPPPSACLSPSRRSARRETLEEVKAVVKGVVCEMKNHVKDMTAELEARMPSTTSIVAAMTPAVVAAAVAAIGAPAAANCANAGGTTSPTGTRAAVATAVVPSLMRGAFKVSLCRRVKKTLFDGCKDSSTFIAPPASGSANRWAREHADEMVYGTVNRTYKAHQALPQMPAIFEGKLNFRQGSQDEIDRAMVAIVRNSLADGRSAMRVRFFSEIGFFKVWASSTVRVRMLHPQEEEPLAAQSAGSKFFAYQTTRVVTPVGAVVPAADAVGPGEGGVAPAAMAAAGARVVTVDSCLMDVAEAMVQAACKCPSTFEPIVLKAIASDCRSIIMDSDPMWPTMRSADITGIDNGPGRWYLLCPKLSTRARLTSKLRTMTPETMASLPPPDPEAPVSDSDSDEDGAAGSGGEGEDGAAVEGPDDW